MNRDKDKENVQFPDLFGPVMRHSELVVAAHYLLRSEAPIAQAIVEAHHFEINRGIQQLWTQLDKAQDDRRPLRFADVIDESDDDAKALRAAIMSVDPSEYGYMELEDREAMLVAARALRKAATDGKRISELIFQQRFQPDQALDGFVKVVEELRTVQIGSEMLRHKNVAMDVGRETINTAQNGVAKGLPMPFRAMQEALGGWQPGRAHYILAVSSGHKTTLLRVSAEHLARAGYQTDYITFEDRATDLVTRSISAEPGCPFAWRDIMFGDIPKDKLPAMVQTLTGIERADIPLFYRQKPPPLKGLVALMHERVAKAGTRCFCIDYVQIVKYESRASRSDRLEYVAETLRETADELDAVLIVAAQTTQGATEAALNENRALGMYDIKHSSGVVQSAFGLITLHFPHDQLVETRNGREHVVGYRRIPDRIQIIPRKWKAAGVNQPMNFGLDAAHDRIYEL